MTFETCSIDDKTMATVCSEEFCLSFQKKYKFNFWTYQRIYE